MRRGGVLVLVGHLVLLAACGAPRRPPPPPEFFRAPELPPTNPRALQLRGRVLTPEGKPVANATVLVIGGGHSGERVLTNAAGEFQVSGLPATQHGYAAVHVPGFAVHVREPVRIAETMPESITLRLEPERVLEGLVVDPDGRSLANARVDARGARRLTTPIRRGATWESVLQLDTVRTDADGRFRFHGLYAGEYELTAHWPRALECTSKTVARAGDLGVRVRVDPAANEQVLFVGRVVDATSRAPIEGVEVFARTLPTDGDEFLSQTATTDEAGAFVLGPFPPAIFHLEASYHAAGTHEPRTWRSAGARDPGVHRLEIELLGEGPR